MWDPTFRDWTAEMRSFSGHLSTVMNATFSPHGQHIVTAGDDGTARVWKTFEAEFIALPPEGGALFDVAYGPGGDVVVTAGQHGVSLWDLESQAAIRNLGNPSHQYEAVDISPDGSRVVSTDLDGTVEIWNAGSGDRLFELHAGETQGELLRAQRAMPSVEYSPDGTHIATSDGGNIVRTWDAATGRVEATLYGVNREIWDVSWSPDGEWVVAASGDGTARVWNIGSGDTEVVLNHGGEVYGAEFSPDGTMIATSGEDLTVWIWDLQTGKQLRTLRGHTDPVLSVAFSPDGQRIATSSADRTVRIWDTRSGQLLDVLGGFVNNVWRAEFSPDGDHVVAVSSDWTLQEFRCELCLSKQGLLRLAESRASRDLTTQERQQFHL